MTAAFLVDAVRTPVGRHGGALAGVRPDDLAAVALLLAGLPTTVPGTTVSRLCGSGLEAVVQASRAVEVGDAGLCEQVTWSR